MQEPALQSILQKGWFISTFPRRSVRAYIITLTSEAISAQPKPFCIRCRRESWEMLCEGGRQERKDLSWLTHPFCVNVWMPYCIFMSCRGLLNTNAASHHVPSHKLFFCQTSVPLCPDFIIHIPVPSHTGGSVLACFPPFFFFFFFAVIWWSLCWNVNTLPNILRWQLAISFSRWNTE